MNNATFSISGQVVLLAERKIVSSAVKIVNGRINSIEPDPNAPQHFILPGFVDAHIHIESSMLIPSAFAKMAVKHGTVATVSDPHEIANVLGIPGINFMLNNANSVPFKFYFGAPSCVPATEFETSGAFLGPDEIEELLLREEIVYLAEMMNYPGVLNKDPQVMKKLAIAQRLNKKIDGHAPGLRGEACKNYIDQGISTDHECTTYEEAKEKIAYGMYILIREGSAAKNFDELIALLKEYPEAIMFCSDDKHPHDLVKGHINLLVKRALEKGIDLYDCLNAAITNPIEHYGLDVGLLNIDDPADFIVVKDLENFEVISTYIDGIKVFENDQCFFESRNSEYPNHFNRSRIELESLKLQGDAGMYKVIKVMDGQLLTKEDEAYLQTSKLGELLTDIEKDILKIAVLSRYDQSEAALAFIKGFTLKRGAIASSVAHDSHNIIAVGCNDEDLRTAINIIIENKGGIAMADGNIKAGIPLPIAGLMTDSSGEVLAVEYEYMMDLSRKLGSTLFDPFMMLSFCALLVIPELKLSDKGLFNGNTFKFVDLKN